VSANASQTIGKAARESEDAVPRFAKRTRRRSAAAQKPAGHQPREDAPGGRFRTRPPHAAGAPHPGVKDLPHRSRRQTITGRGACRVWRLETGAASNSGAARRVPAFFGFARNGNAPARPRAGMRRSHVCVIRRAPNEPLLALDGRGGSARRALTEWVASATLADVAPATHSVRLRPSGFGGQLAHQGRAGRR
jgi:hypothetical protein